MSAEDRDRLFEKALARHLRADAGVGDPACLDSEVLAAYYEGALSEEGLSAAKSHLAACPRCQEIVTQLAATETVNELQKHEDQLVVGGAVSQPRNDEGKVAHFPSKKKWLLRWAAPAAIAAAILLYLGARDFRLQTKRSDPATQVAENREDSATAHDSYMVPAAPQAIPKQKDDDLTAKVSRQQAGAAAPGAVRDEMEKTRRKAESPDDLKSDKKPAQAGTLASPKIQPPPAPQAQGKDLAKTESLDSAAKSAAVDSLQKRADAQQTQSVQAQSSGAVTATPASPASSPAPPVALSPVPAPEKATGSAGAAPAPKKKEADLPAMSRNAISNLALEPSAVTAQNGNSIWKFGEHGAIAHSGDGGKTWKSQVAAVSVTLTSGSAPAKNICWIAGAAGTLLRTTDGGNHWQLIVTPIAGDLGGVLARDGKHATIWDTPRRETFQTSNGGKTWEKKTAE